MTGPRDASRHGSVTSHVWRVTQDHRARSRARSRQMGVTFSALGPFGPMPSVNETR
jgi:hypothetical protein